MKVSVIIPVFNAEKYLCECLDSVISQTLEEIEIICVDDGSTDRSLDILESYAAKDKRVKILKQTNKYAGVARNNGLRVAQGKYVLFLDADDIFEKSMLETMYFQAEKDDLDIAICNVLLMDDATKEIRNTCWKMEAAPRCVFSLKNVRTSENTLQMFSLAAWNKLFKKEFVIKNDINFQPLKKYNDNYFVIVALALAERIKFIDKRFVTYRVNNDNSLQGNKNIDNHAADVCDAFVAIKKKLQEQGMYEMLKQDLLNNYLDDFVGALMKQCNYENFALVYNRIKISLPRDLEIEEHEKEFWYNEKNYEIAKEIHRMELSQYLYKYYEICNKEYSYFRHMLPKDKMLGSRRIAVYGAGKRGRAYVGQIINNPEFELAAWLDRNYKNIDMGVILVQAPEEIKQISYDKILVAVADEKLKYEIKEYLMQLGVDEKKII